MKGTSNDAAGLMRVRGYRLCHTFHEGDGVSYSVKLWQFPQGARRFAVTYGAQFACALSYAEAMAELGGCLMHALACAGAVDNEGA